MSQSDDNNNNNEEEEEEEDEDEVIDLDMEDENVVKTEENKQDPIKEQNNQDLQKQDKNEPIVVTNNNRVNTNEELIKNKKEKKEVKVNHLSKSSIGKVFFSNEENRNQNNQLKTEANVKTVISNVLIIIVVS
jgi:hypothetical protein